MIKSTRKLPLLLIIFSGLFLVSCHGTKKISIGRGYRNLTAYYNTYFNAREIYKQDLRKIELNNPDHFDRTLAFYKLGDEASAAGLTSDMNQVILKCSNLITKHDKSDWVDDSYLLMGKAYYLKGDYYQALDNFQFIYNNFPDQIIKEAGLVWATRTYMKLDKTEDAQVSLDLALGAGPKARKKNSDELYTTAARFYLDEADTTRAQEMMRLASTGCRDHLLATRYYFIRAQLAAQRMQQGDALALYHKVLSASPGYELTFGAKLGIANIAGGSDQIQKGLESLLRDEKSLDYRDQVYYSLGINSTRNNQFKKALYYFQRALNFNTGNTNQRGLAYEQMAEIYLNQQKDYKKASVYYDSTMNFLARDYSNYAALQKKQSKLGALIAGYKFIDQQDTLLLLASMDSAKRIVRVRSIIMDQINIQKEAEMAAVLAYKKQMSASNVRFAAQSAAGAKTGNGLNSLATPQASFLQTNGGTGQQAMSTYQPSASNQMQIYAQGASSTGSVSTAAYGSGSSSAGSSGMGGNSAFAGNSTFGGTTASTSGAYQSSYGSSSGGMGNSSVPVYGTSTSSGMSPGPSMPSSQGMSSGQSYGGSSGSTQGQSNLGVPQGGAALYGGTSFNTVGSGGGGGSSMSGSQASSTGYGAAQTGMVSSNGMTGAAGQSGSTSTIDPATGNSTFIANTGAVNLTSAQAQAALSQNAAYGNQNIANSLSGGIQNQGYGTQSGQNQAYGNQSGQNQAYGNQSGQNQAYGNQSGQNQAYGNSVSYSQGGYASNAAGNGNVYNSFYFANPQAMSAGYSQFVQKWGSRPLRDNWRRSSRQAGSDQDKSGGPDTAMIVRRNQIILETAASDPRKAEKALMSQVPVTKAEMDSVRNTITSVYAVIAGIYQFDLKDLQKAISTYEILVHDFPADKNIPQYCFQLYTLYTQLGNTTRAAGYRERIITEFSRSVYADYFLHPEQLVAAKTTDPVLESYYDSTYQAWQNHRFAEVIKRARNIPVAPAVNYLQAQFDYLYTLSTGYTQPLAVFEPVLKNFSTRYATTAPGKEAIAMLKGIDSNRAVIGARQFALEGFTRDNGFEIAQQEADRKEAAALREKERIAAERKKFFSPDYASNYQLMVLFNSDKINMRPVRLGLSQFAAANFATYHLTNTLDKVAARPAMLVGNFSSFKAAMTYYKALTPVREDVIPVSQAQYEYYIISPANKAKLTDAATMQIYREFFEDNYAPFATDNHPEWPSALSVAPVSGTKKGQAEVIPAAAFSKDADSPYLLIIAVNSTKVNLNPVRLQISIFNQLNFMGLHLNHQTLLFNKETLIISVNTFTDLAAASAYYKRFMAEKPGISTLQDSQYQVMLISKGNYNKLHDISDLSNYYQFFNSSLKQK